MCLTTLPLVQRIVSACPKSKLFCVPSLEFDRSIMLGADGKVYTGEKIFAKTLFPRFPHLIISTLNILGDEMLVIEVIMFGSLKCGLCMMVA